MHADPHRVPQHRIASTGQPCGLSTVSLARSLAVLDGVHGTRGAAAQSGSKRETWEMARSHVEVAVLFTRRIPGMKKQPCSSREPKEHGIADREEAHGKKGWGGEREKRSDIMDPTQKTPPEKDAQRHGAVVMVPAPYQHGPDERGDVRHSHELGI